MAGDDVRVHRVAEHRKSALQVRLPECFPKLMLAALRNIIHEEIQPVLLFLDFGNQLLHLRGFEVIDDHGDAFSAPRCHQLGGFLNRLRPPSIVVRWKCLLAALRG